MATIYIGGIDESIDPEELRARFSKYGIINDIRGRKNFAFIDFTNKRDADRAVEVEHGKHVNGKKLVVEHSKPPPKKVPIELAGFGESSSWAPKRPQSDGMDRPQNGGRMNAEQIFMQVNQLAEKSKRLDNQYGEGPPDPKRMNFGRPQEPGRAPPPFGNREDQFRAGPAPPVPAPPPPEPAGDAPNDCEIIATRKFLRNYAEHVEKAIKNLGLRVDILFPNPEASIDFILRDITSRRVLYAVELDQESEYHQMAKVTFLQVRKQRTMNCPLKDALSLIRQNAEERGRLQPVKSLPQAAPPQAPMADMMKPQSRANPSSSPVTREPSPPPSDNRSRSPPRRLKVAHPEEIEMIMGIFHEGRPLSVIEYDTLIDYLTEKREAMAKRYNAPPRSSGKAPEPGVQKQLYNDVLSILKSNAGGGERKAPPPPPPQPQSSAALAAQMDVTDLNSPLMKKALQGLLANKNALEMLHSYSSRVLGDKTQR